MKPEDQGVEMENDRGAYLSTWSGNKFYPLDPRPEEIDIEDIANALAKQTRFNGHLRRFYSVAQHSVLCSWYVDSDDALVALTALLHDAPEAYIGDMIRPVKVYDDWFRYIDDRIWQVIAEKFNIPVQMPDEVHDIDGRMCAAEKRDLHNFADPWPNMPDPEGIPKIQAWDWETSRNLFLIEYYNLVHKLERTAA